MLKEYTLELVIHVSGGDNEECDEKLEEWIAQHIGTTPFEITNEIVEE